MASEMADKDNVLLWNFVGKILISFILKLYLIDLQSASLIRW